MKTIFAKYNRERLPKYQIVTKIVVDEDGHKYALKEALCDEAMEHIENIYFNYELLKSSYNINLVKPTKLEKGLLFEMADGKSLENILLESLNNNDEVKFKNYIDKFLSFLDGMVSRRNVEFIPSKEFEAIFGKWKISENQDIVKVANVDLIFGNIFVNKKDEFSLIDYEWVFDFEIPKSYIVWRSLVIFSTYHSVNFDNKYINSIINLNNEYFLELDEFFATYVHGVNKKYFFPSSVAKVPYFINLDDKDLISNSNYFIQFFMEEENDFSEENSLKLQVLKNTEIQKFDFDLKNKIDMKSLRLDPLNDSCIVEIERLYILLENGKKIDLISHISTNAYILIEKKYFFETIDSQIHIRIAELNLNHGIKKLCIELKYNHIGKEAVYICVNQIITDKNQKISVLENELNTIYNSRSWLIVNKIKNIYKKINFLKKR
jgi:hypothetical protein